MREFIIKVIMFCGIVYVCLGLINEAYINTNDYKYVLEARETLKFKEVPRNITIANMGNSHAACGIYYEQDDIIGFNFATAAQDLSWDYEILDKYKKHFAKGAVLFIPISYFSLAYDTDYEAESRYLKYYDFLDPSHILDFNLSTYLSRGLFPVVNAKSNMDKMFDDIEMQVRPKIEKRTSSMYGCGDAYMNQQASAQFTHQMEDVANGFIDIRDESILALDGIINICKEYEITPVFLIMPYTRNYNEQGDEEFYERFYSQMEFLGRRYPEVGLLDYSNDERFINRLEFYRDTDHLNIRGARAFTEILIEEGVGKSR